MSGGSVGSKKLLDAGPIGEWLAGLPETSSELADQVGSSQRRVERLRRGEVREIPLEDVDRIVVRLAHPEQLAILYPED